MKITGTGQGRAAPSRRMDGHIHVCPLSAVPDIVAGCNASHLVTCLQDEFVVETPSLIKPDNHVRLHVDDIAHPNEGPIEEAGRKIDEKVENAKERLEK